MKKLGVASIAAGAAALIGVSFAGSAQAYQRHKHRHGYAHYLPSHATYYAPVRHFVYQPVPYVVYRPRVEYVHYAPVRYYYPVSYQPTCWRNCDCD